MCDIFAKLTELNIIVAWLIMDNARIHKTPQLHKKIEIIII